MTETVIQTSPWTPDMIVALFTGIERILMALGGIALTLLGLWLQNRSARAEGRAAGAARDAQIAEVHSAVNGPVTGQLRQIAGLLEEKAAQTGTPVDRALADDAQVRLDSVETKK